MGAGGVRETGEERAGSGREMLNAGREQRVKVERKRYGKLEVLTPLFPPPFLIPPREVKLISKAFSHLSCLDKDRISYIGIE